MSKSDVDVLVLGAGPAGLTAGYMLTRSAVDTTVVEAQGQVGGLAQTVEIDGYRFDLGGHRFFTKSSEVESLWHELMGEEFLLTPRLSRIYWHGKLLDYPLVARDVIRKLGPVELLRAGLSYTWAAATPNGPEETFEDWVSNRFGRRLYELFFKSYTEKVWGVPTTEIRAEWAAQRIKGVSFFTAARSALLGHNEKQVKSLIQEFHYPRYGPGQMWDTMTRAIEENGGRVELNEPVTRLEMDGRKVRAVETTAGRYEPRQVISSLPLRTTVSVADPAVPDHVRNAAQGLRYRDFLTVALILEGEDLFPDNWIYIHEPGVKVGRIQNYRSWSPWMVPDPDKACVGLEYFCFEGDSLWSASDEALVDLATKELAALRLADPSKVERGYVVRVPKAYPMYDERYAERVTTIREWLDPLENLQQVGRNGLHRYNNSDHSMLTAIRAVENFMSDADHDIWAVNVDSAYHEEFTVDEHPYRAAPETPAMAESVAVRR
jgi:protoporphyrinogen oxidase